MIMIRTIRIPVRMIMLINNNTNDNIEHNNNNDNESYKTNNASNNDNGNNCKNGNHNSNSWRPSNIFLKDRLS